MIGIIDYGAGNLQSVKNALDKLGAEYLVVDKPEKMQQADKIILPGVGSFGFMMQSLREKGLEEPLKKSIADGIPALGICLGLQVLFEESEESPGIKGLCIFRGKVVRFSNGKVPQIGWNNIMPRKKGIFDKGYVYFVNSYYAVPEEKSVIAATTDYFGTFASAIQCKNVTAVQFHPEKSGEFGINIIRRWSRC